MQQPRRRRLPVNTTAKNRTADAADGREERITGRTPWDLLAVVAGAFKRPAVAIPASLGLIGGSALLLTTGYLHVFYGEGVVTVGIGAPADPDVKGTVERAATARIEKHIAAGRELNRPYILDAVTVLIRVDDVASGPVRERVVNWRIIYTVRALQTISRTDKFFKERYSSDVARVRRWFGSEKEIRATDDAYTVMMDIPAGETRTIVTGATFVYSLPLAGGRQALGQAVQMTQAQEFYSYPNEEDVIGELTMLIESDSLKISPVGQSAKRSKPDGSIAPDEEVRFSKSDDRRTLSARWKEVMPKEEVGLYFEVE
jgi:hypothetical protein